MRFAIVGLFFNLANKGGSVGMSIESYGLGDQEASTITKRVYTIEEVAKILGLGRNAAYVAARADRLPVRTIKIGRRLMVSKAALDRLVADC